MTKNKKYRMLIWSLAAVVILLFLNFGAKYILYLRSLHKSYTITKDYYEVKGGFWEFKNIYENMLAEFASRMEEEPFFIDSYNRRYYLPFVTGHNYGFIQQATSLEPSENVTRILCLGSSIVERGFPEFLQEVLDSIQPGKFEIINAGIPGASILHIFMNYSFMWRQLQPHIVIIEYNSDALPRSGTQPFAISKDFDPSQHRIFSRAESLQSRPRGPFKGILITHLLKDIITKVERNEHPVPDGLVRYRTILESLILMTKASGVRPVLVTSQPALSNNEPRGNFSTEFYERILVFYQAFFFNFTIEGAIETIDAHNNIIRKLAREHGVTLVDIVGAIPRTDEYYLDGAHYSRKAGQIIAQKIAERLLNEGSLFK